MGILLEKGYLKWAKDCDQFQTAADFFNKSCVPGNVIVQRAYLTKRGGQKKSCHAGSILYYVFHISSYGGR